jgi:hypothetical protein
MVAVKLRLGWPLAAVSLEACLGQVGDRQLVDQQGGRLDNLGIGRDDVTLGEHDQVARHHLGRAHVALLAVADQPRHGRGQLPQRRHRPIGAHLLGNPDRGVDHHDQQDDRGVGQVTRRDGEYPPEAPVPAGHAAAG